MTTQPDLRVVPLPPSARTRDHTFALLSAPTIHHPPELSRIAFRLARRLSRPTGVDFSTRRDSQGAGIELGLDSALGVARYRLTVTEDGVQIVGGDPAAVHAGTETLLQLLPPAVYRQARVADGEWIVPGVEILDSPRFEWRALLLDVARHFVPRQEILHLIDLMSMHKLNVLQLHLADDQGWRMEIKRHPLLVGRGGWRHESKIGVSKRTDGIPHGGFYTQAELREIVEYAADRFITVVPEIDVPAHTQAAIAAYPELGLAGRPCDVLTRWGEPDQILNAEEATIEFFRGVFDEVLDVFPSPVVAIGGDEVPFRLWEQDDATRRRMVELGLRDPRQLHGWIIEKIGGFLRERGRRIIGWDEIVGSGAPADAMVASWRGDRETIEAARRGHEVVSCPTTSTYLDYRQSDDADEPTPVGNLLTLADVYEFSPIPAGLPEELESAVVGGQANLWTEHMPSRRYREYMLFPRLCAFADAVWRSGLPDHESFARVLEGHLERLAVLDVGFRPIGEPTESDRLTMRSLAGHS